MGFDVTWPLVLDKITDAEMLALVTTAEDWDTYENSDQWLDVFFFDWIFYAESVSPALYTLFKEDRESGNFTANGWTVVNDTTNQWVVGTADVRTGTYSCYISDDAWVSAAYDETTTQVSHIYKDVVIPAWVSDLVLKARWKTVWEAWYDRMETFIAPTTVTPVAWTEVLATYKVWPDWNWSGSWNEWVISFWNAYSWTTIRLIISWRNDWSVGTNPGGLFDEFSVLYR